jgi:hypothetical protein
MALATQEYGMSDRAVEFVESWVSEHIAEDAQLGDAAVRAEGLAVQCLAAAADEGISSFEIGETFDNLTAFIAGEIEEAKNRQAHRDAAADE